MFGDIPNFLRGGSKMSRRPRATRLETCLGISLVIAFSTAHRIAHWPEALTATQTVLADEGKAMYWLFPAVVESVEEAVLNSLFRAETVVGRDGHTRVGLPVEQVLALVPSRRP